MSKSADVALTRLLDQLSRMSAEDANAALMDVLGCGTAFIQMTADGPVRINPDDVFVKPTKEK